MPARLLAFHYWRKLGILVNWPEAERWRFCEPKAELKTGGRFPVTDWIVERMQPTA